MEFSFLALSPLVLMIETNTLFSLLAIGDVLPALSLSVQANRTTTIMCISSKCCCHSSQEWEPLLFGQYSHIAKCEEQY
jgi:hypothetical protein